MKCEAVIDTNPQKKLVPGNIYISAKGDGDPLYIAVKATGKDDINLVSLKTGTIYFNCDPEKHIDVTDKVKVVSI